METRAIKVFEADNKLALQVQVSDFLNRNAKSHIVGYTTRIEIDSKQQTTIYSILIEY